MQKNTTDHIAKLSWDAVKTHWKAFIVLPTIPFVLMISLIIGVSTMRSQGSIYTAFSSFIPIFQLGLFLFYLIYHGAVAFWCQNIFSGKKTLDIKAGLRFGLSRASGTLGTGLLTLLKTFLWTMLFVLPGFYKMLTYAHSIQISQFEKMSGGSANRLSQTLIKEAGLLRTLGNFGVLGILLYLTLIPVYLLAVVGFIIGAGIKNAGSDPYIMMGALMIVLGVLFFTYLGAMISFQGCFKNFQYLIYREENKTAFEKALKKELKIIKG